MMRLTPVRIALIGAALVVSLAACGSSPNELAADSITEWQGDPLPADVFQYTADGDVTIEELSAAQGQVVACFESEGFGGTVIIGSNGLPSVSLSGKASDDEALVQAVYDKCSEAHVGPLVNIYQTLHLVSGEERDAEFAKWHEFDGPVPGWPDDASYCIEKYYFVLWPEALG